ncbi:SDR family NAD(P)-dependent oxidoreductase [Streptomyces sp. MS1.HAVA.3]|uniref:SDR family NAD(P)-dependent oxidoreductase n=1 Tax=Streptomyces caledonius TaxID=3134107 RepID=A0ABU8U0L3_9ACTN
MTAANGASPVRRSAEAVMEVVLDIVHTRTGYPLDMLDPGLDLEADLSIDSIKRVEIIGALADRIGLPRTRAAPPRPRSRSSPGSRPCAGSWTGSPPTPAQRSRTLGRNPSPGRGGRAARRGAGRPAPGGHGPRPGGRRRPGFPARPARRGRRGRPGHRPRPRRGPGRARRRGDDPAEAEPGSEGEAWTGIGCDGIVDLSALRAGAEPVLPEAFPGLRRALVGGVRRLLLVGAPGSPGGAGLHGFARSAALEFPGALVRAVDVHPKEAPEQIAAQLLAELSSDAADGAASVGYTAEGTRVTRRPVPAPLLTSDGPPVLEPGSVVLLTGGARGITARTALALARATGCHVELVGRTPEPAAEADGFGQAQDRVALRAALIASGLRTPVEIESAASRILAEREVRATLAALATAAASVRYHCADVTDERAVRAVVADVRERHGRLDGIVHGAGVLRDGLLRDKQPADFAEVFTTKVAGARHLAAAAAEHGAWPAPRFLALFGSVAGVYGNRGQSDYAAANDALDGLAHTWAESFPGRVLSVDWGPWAAEAGGMVTPELERAYARRGIPLISPDSGTAAFLAELAHGTDVQVVLMASAQEGRGDE